MRRPFRPYLSFHKSGPPLNRGAGRRPLPFLFLLTDDRRLPHPEAALASMPAGSAVIFRHYGAPDRAALARRMARLCRKQGVLFLVAGDLRLAWTVGADGVHFPEYLIRRAPHACKAWQATGRLITAAAHSEAAVLQAARFGVDAVLLSPVFPTASHPEAAPLGLLRLAAVCRTSPVPVYALGGVRWSSLRRLENTGAAGVAGISLLKNS